MMFQLDTAFSLELIAITLGLSMLIWGKRNEGNGIALAKLSGTIITLLAIFALLCTSYYGTIYWTEGYFAHPNEMMTDNQNHSH